MNSALTVDFSTCRACQGPCSAAEHLLMLPLPSTWPLFIFLQLMLQVFYDGGRCCTHKNSQGARRQCMLHFPCHFLAGCHHQEQPGTLCPAEHRPHTCATPGAVCRGTYSHEGPAQIDGCAAPIHGVIQDTEGETGHFCLLQDAEVITCRANRGFLVRVHDTGGHGAHWYPPHSPARDEKRR